MREAMFTVEMKPRGKDRPRVVRAGGFARTYTPKETTVAEAQVRETFRHECKHDWPDAVMDSPITMSVVAYFMPPKRLLTKKHAASIEAETLRHMTKPDGDNVLKLVADALDGIAYRSDSLITDAEVHKRYSLVPRIEVRLTALDSE